MQRIFYTRVRRLAFLVPQRISLPLTFHASRFHRAYALSRGWLGYAPPEQPRHVHAFTKRRVAGLCALRLLVGRAFTSCDKALSAHTSSRGMIPSQRTHRRGQSAADRNCGRLTEIAQSLRA